MGKAGGFDCGNEMSKLSKRLEKLENIISPPKPKKYVRVIQKVGETQEQAIAKAGITDPEGSKIWIIRLVAPKPKLQPGSEENM